LVSITTLPTKGSGWDIADRPQRDRDNHKITSVGGLFGGARTGLRTEFGHQTCQCLRST
jgi:hypothetical protein